jgi:hypothetical protein
MLNTTKAGRSCQLPRNRDLPLPPRRIWGWDFEPMTFREAKWVTLSHAVFVADWNYHEQCHDVPLGAVWHEGQCLSPRRPRSAFAFMWKLTDRVGVIRCQGWDTWARGSCRRPIDLAEIVWAGWRVEQ